MNISTLVDSWEKSGTNYKEMKKFFMDYDASFKEHPAVKSSALELLSYADKVSDDDNLRFFILRDDYLMDIKEKFQAQVGSIKKQDYPSQLLDEVVDTNIMLRVHEGKGSVNVLLFFVSRMALRSFTQVLHCKCDQILSKRDLFSDMFLANSFKKEGNDNPTYSIRLIYREENGIKKIFKVSSSKQTLIPYSDMCDVIEALKIEDKEIKYTISNSMCTILVRLNENEFSPCLILQNSYTGDSSFSVSYGITDKEFNYLVGETIGCYSHDGCYDKANVIAIAKASKDGYQKRIEEKIAEFLNKKDELNLEVEVTECLASLGHKNKFNKFCKEYLTGKILAPKDFLCEILKLPLLYNEELKNSIELQQVRKRLYPFL